MKKIDSDYDFFDILEAVTEHPIDRETKDIMKDSYSIKNKSKLIKKLEKQIKKLKG